MKLLLDVLLLRKGIGHTLNELNKIIALSGLTLAAIAFLPIHLFDSKTNLLWNCLYTQIFHAVYSTYKFYGDKNMPELLSWLSVVDDFKSKSKKQQNVGAKKLSNILSVVAFSLLIGIVLNYFNMRKSDIVCFLMLLVSVFHFYFMEISITCFNYCRMSSSHMFCQLPHHIFFTLQLIEGFDVSVCNTY